MNTLKNICSNCGNSLRGRFCHACGQQANEPRRAVIGLVQDVFVDTLWIDSRLWRSIVLLLFKPGRLARHYLDGKRMYYTPPFRMYLFASVFFFFCLFWIIGSPLSGEHADDFWQGFEEGLNSDGEQNVEVPGLPPGAVVIMNGDRDEAPQPATPESDSTSQAASQEQASSPEADETDTAGEETETADATPPEETSGEETSDSDADGPPWELLEDREFDDVNYGGPEWFRPHARKFYYGLKAIVQEPRLFVASVQANLPRVMLLAPLLYALILALLYIYRRKYLFYDHLVISLYMHGALYAYMLIALLIEPIPVVKFLTIPLVLWAMIQPYAVFRQAYGSPWISVIMKGMLSTSIYNTLIFLLVLVGLSYSIYQV